MTPLNHRFLELLTKCRKLGVSFDIHYEETSDTWYISISSSWGNYMTRSGLLPSAYIDAIEYLDVEIKDQSK